MTTRPIGLDAELLARELIAQLPGMAPTTHLLSQPAAALACKAQEDRSSLCAGHGIAATIVGAPFWFSRQDSRGGESLIQCVLASFRERGAQCIDTVAGSFALAVLDPTARRVLLAVDRMGTQPMCYAITDAGDLVFGSSADAVRAHPLVDKSLDSQAIYDYLYFHVVPSPRTIYRQVRKLGPGELLWFEDGRARISRYWSPQFTETSHTPLAELSTELLARLEQAIERCNPEQHTGAFLSGGLDSSTVAGLLARRAHGSCHVYTIGFSQAGYDEMEYARTTARHFGNQLHEYYLTHDDVVSAIPELARAYDEPFGNSSAIPALYCARMARQHGSHVLLAGDGGDELFAGNTRYATQKLFEMYFRLPAWARRDLLEPLLRTRFGHMPGPVHKLRRYVEQACTPMPDRTQAYNFLHLIGAQEIFESEFLRAVDVEQPLQLLRDTYQAAPAESLLNRMLYLDWKFTLADNDLRKVNRMCELAGVDVRYPFLDDDVVAFANRVPSELKLKGLKLRYFYKFAMRDFLPRKVIDKTKHGFGLPFGQWLHLSPALQGLIYGSLNSLKRRGIIRPAYIDRLIESHRREHAAYFGSLVWLLAMLEQWFQQHGFER
ncbi:MAG: asparagine synthetase B family protein [Gammaproteobacteria bacterium]